jgi:hypothetical protein
MAINRVPVEFAPLFWEETDEVKEINDVLTVVTGTKDKKIAQSNMDWMNIQMKHLNRQQRQRLEREDLFDHYAKKRNDTVDRMRAKLAARKKN